MNEKLVILWTSNDKEVALHMVFMYAQNCMISKWWDEVELVIWGPTARLTANDEDIKTQLQTLNHLGVKIKACSACAERYGVTQNLQSQNIEVVGMGQPLTDYLKAGVKVLTL